MGRGVRECIDLGGVLVVVNHFTFVVSISMVGKDTAATGVNVDGLQSLCCTLLDAIKNSFNGW